MLVSGAALSEYPPMSLQHRIAKRISRLYFIAIALIALLALISQGYLQLYLHQLSFDAREINLAGKMRMLSQRTVKLGLLMERTANPALYREQLLITTAELSEIFEGLTTGSESLEVQPPPTPEAEALFDTAAPILQTTLDAAEQLTAASPDSDAFKQSLQTLIDNDDALLEAIARIPTAYDAIAKRDVVRLEWIELGLLLLTLLILAFELRFIFRPILRIALDALAKVQQDVVEAQRLRRLASMGEMSGGVAHELNSPLAALSFAIQRLQRRISRGREITHQDLSEQLDKMSADAVRMGEIVQSIRALAAGKLPEPKKPEHADALLRHVADVFQRRYARQNLRIDIKPGCEQVIVCCIAYQMEQVLTNLLKNAAEATAHLDQPWVELAAEADKDTVRLIVRDAGMGIADELVERIYDPFYTTKTIGSGMGLGLALCQKLTELHGGRVHYELLDGHTAFVVTLPSTECTDTNSVMNKGLNGA